MSEETPDTVDYMRAVADRVLGDTEVAFPQPPGHVEPVVGHLETANRHRDAGARLPGPTRFGWAKKLMLRFARLYTTEQAAYNQAVLAALHALDYNINTARIDARDRLDRVEAAVAATERVARELARQYDRLHARLAALEAATTELAQGHAVERARLDLFLQEARRRLPEPFDASQLEALTADVDAWLAPLYAQLEERFRGSRGQIIALQEDYLPDILGLGGGAPVVDVGCGRGEWLELLAENGVEAYGVDTNDTFVKRNVERGLDVRHADAVEHLLSIEPGSIAAVTAFHIVEHMEFADAVRLVDAALVALRPGGLLVFETPNPTNLVVGASTFYLDPTHRNPIHPAFLQFLVESRGFVDVEVRDLHPSTDPHFPLPDDPAARQPVEQLNRALFGPQDYAVVGRKVA